MAYVDGFVLVVPTKNLKSYLAMASKAGKVWMEHGALDYHECVGDDLTPKGVTATFPKLVGAKRGETVVFSWIAYKSKKHRDATMAKVMADPRLAKMMDPNNPPFDMSRMSYGGFETEVDYTAKPKRAAKVAKPAKSVKRAKTAKSRTR
jgi:uncharacterized protein YbaA (DUF1428 family)